MTTFNRTWRSPKFFLCTHVTDEYYIELEKAEHRFSHYAFVTRGGGTLHVLRNGKFEANTPIDAKKLIDVSIALNCNVVGETFQNTKLISFNSWKKTDKWNGRMLETGTIKSNESYSCVVVFEGSCTINGKTIEEMNYVNLIKSKEYPIIVPENSSVAFFELYYELL